jgi:hypothetical protein
MGTRNLTVLVHEGEVKICQYGQWDGYPDGQGVVALNFLHRVEEQKLLAQLKTLKIMDENDEKELDVFLKSLGSNDGWLTMEQADSYYKKYPYLHRNNGADILNLMYDNDESNKLIRANIEDFADGLFIEWAYVIDLDQRVFEVYDGFHQNQLSEDHRFFDVITEVRMKEEENLKQWEIRAQAAKDAGKPFDEKKPYVRDTIYNLEKVTSWSLDKLPTKEEFLEYFERRNEKE